MFTRRGDRNIAPRGRAPRWRKTDDFVTPWLVLNIARRRQAPPWRPLLSYRACRQTITVASLDTHDSPWPVRIRHLILRRATRARSFRLITSFAPPRPM